MDRFERVFAALAGEPVDRIPVALWRHHPGSDTTARDLGRSTLGWQAEYDWDLLKITPGAGYPVEPWGATFVYPGVDPMRIDRGIREAVEASRPVQGTADWGRIGRVDVPSDPFLTQLVEATAHVTSKLGGTVPIVQTIFSPGYAVMNMAGRDRFLADIRADPERLRPAFEAATEATIDLGRALLGAGADGLLFSTFLAARAWLTSPEFRELCMPYDLQVLEAIRPRTKILIHHIHGDDVYFDLVAAYPADAVNWEDRTTASLAEGKARTDKCVIGGIAEPVLLGGRPDDVRAEVREAVASTGGRRLIVGTGCVTPVIVPEENIRAARDAVEDMALAR